MRIEKNVVYRNKKHRRASGRFVVFLVYFVRSFSTHALHMDRTYESSKRRHISAEATLSSPWNIYAYTFRFALEYSLAFYKIYRTCFIFRRLFVSRMARRVDDSNFYAYTFATGVGGIHAGMVEWPTMHPYANCAMCHVHCTRIDYKWISFRFGFFRRSQFFYFFSYFCSSVFRRLFIFYTKSNFSSAKYSQVACVAVGRSRVPKLIDYFYFLFLTSCTAQNIIKHNKLVPWTYATHIAQHTRVDAYSGTY